MKVFGYALAVAFILLATVSLSPAQSINVVSAYYGTSARSRDVTGRVQRFADFGEPFRVSNDTFRMDPVPGQKKTLVVSTTWGAGESRTASRREMYSISEVVATPMRAPVITGAEYKFSTLPTEQEGDTRTSPVSFRILSESGNHSRFQTRPSESTPILA